VTTSSDIYLIPNGSGDEDDELGLVTPETVLQFLGAEDSDVEQPSEDWLDLVIAVVTGTIIHFTGRDYTKAATIESRKYQRFGDSPTIDIDDCQDVTKVEVSRGQGWRQLPTDAWIAEPTSQDRKSQIRFLGTQLPATGIGWYFGQQQNADGTAWPNQSRAEAEAVTFVQVTARYGYTQVPGHIRMAALSFIAHIHRKDKAYFSEAFAQGAKSILDIPPDVLRILESDEKAGPGVTAI